MDKLIKVYHKDWNGECIIYNINNDLNNTINNTKNNTINNTINNTKNNTKNNYKIKRINIENEEGLIEFVKNDIIIKWEKWSSDYCINIYNNIYIEKKYYETLELKYLMNVNKNYVLLIDNQNIININENEETMNLSFQTTNKIYYKNKNYILFLENIYIYENEKNNFFYLDTINFNKKNTYILNKNNKKFFNKNNLNNNGIYIINNNILTLKWSNNIEKNFFSNIYYETKQLEVKQELNYENIKIIRPQKFAIYNKFLFTNINLIKNKIYLVSVNYQDDPWNYNLIDFTILDKTNHILHKNIINYNNYENCTLIILELFKENQTLEIQINYKSHQKEFTLNQLILPKEEIYAMTLFKDDYFLLKKYLEYYSNLGVNCFLLYYNSQISDQFINELNIINQSNYKIIITEWNYDYWYYLDVDKKEKHHHSQVNAINDALYILKNFSNYILYNDLDEYIKLEPHYNTFNDLINKNQEIDIFEFKCLFCKIGETLIKYRNFYFEYDEDKIKKGNFWDKFREKNLIKSSQIDFMGVHEPVYIHCKKNLQKKYVSYFYHFVNFYEKNRIELMTQYIS